MRKKYLLRYYSDEYDILINMDRNLWNYCTYYLSIETVWLWGLFKTNSTKEYYIFQYDNFKSFFDNWDYLIKNKTPLSKNLINLNK